MPELSTFAVFAAAAVALFLAPGPAVLYIVARSIDQGRRAGIISSLGIAAGDTVHVAAAALRVSAILVSSAAAFNLVKYLGAAYLIYLGLRKLFWEVGADAEVRLDPSGLGSVFRQGFLVNLLNPKTALFFFAFFPQFVDPLRGSAALQILVLGVVYLLLGILCDSLWAFAAGSAGNWLRRNPVFLRAQRYFAGTVFLVLGVATAVTGSDRSR